MLAPRNDSVIHNLMPLFRTYVGFGHSVLRLRATFEYCVPTFVHTNIMINNDHSVYVTLHRDIHRASETIIENNNNQ